MNFKQRWFPIDFYKTMEVLSKTFRYKKKMKVKITEKQIGILEYCAFLGIDDFHKLTELTGIEKPKPIKYITIENIDKPIKLPNFKDERKRSK